MADEPSRQSVKGVLIHRAVLASAGKWLDISSAKERHNGVPTLVIEAGWMARRLGAALADRDDDTVWGLIDSGGPYWNEAYEHFRGLAQPDQERALDALEDIATEGAKLLLDEARRDRWKYILSEVIDPYQFFTAHTEQDRKAARSRIDLLVDRGPGSPLIVDLKTDARTIGSARIDTMARGVAAKYGRNAADILGKPVTCRVLHLAFDGRHRWSTPQEANAPQ